MHYRRYVVFNLVSSAVWCGVLLVLGYSIRSITVVGDYLDYLTDLIIILAAAIIITLVLFVHDYVRRRTDIRYKNPELKKSEK